MTALCLFSIAAGEFETLIYYEPETQRFRIDVTGRGLTLSEWTHAGAEQSSVAGKVRFLGRVAERIETDLRLASEAAR